MSRAHVFDELNAAIAAAETRIYTANFGIAATYRIGDDAHLHWAKEGGRWRLWVTRRIAVVPGVEKWPILEAPLPLRVAAARALPDMVQELEETFDASMEDVFAGIKAANSVLALTGEKACDHKFVDGNRCLKCGWQP